MVILPPSYRGPKDILRRYWQCYGGSHAIITSIYVHIAFLITVVTYHIWADPKWPDLVVQILPNLIGFSLASYSVILGLGNDDFKNMLSNVKNKNGISAFLEFNSAFAHFILTQLVALIYSLLAKSKLFVDVFHAIERYDSFLCRLLMSFYPKLTKLFWGFGWFLFVYALLLAIAATLSVFRLAGLYDAFNAVPPTALPPDPSPTGSSTPTD